jgi:hypothetical protein
LIPEFFDSRSSKKLKEFNERRCHPLAGRAA